MATKDEKQTRRDWIEYGDILGGTLLGLQKQLLACLPTTSSMEAAASKRLAVAREYMAHMWLENVSKKQFVGQMKITRRLARTEEQKAQRSWIKGGQMSGEDVSIMQALLEHLPTVRRISAQFEATHFTVARQHMAELWLRGISKKRFIREMRLPRRSSFARR